MTAEQYVQKLLELSYKKLECLREIQKLTEQQSAIIDEENAEALKGKLDMKQIQMDMVDKLDEMFEVYYARLKSFMKIESLEEIRMSELIGSAELKQTVNTIFQITKGIQELEDQNNKKVKAMLLNLADEIKLVNKGKIANNGYNVGGKLQQPAYFFDIKK